MVVLKVMYENGIDAFVNPEQTTAAVQAGGAGEPEVNDRRDDQLLHGVHGAARRSRRWTCRPATRRSSTSRSMLSADKKHYENVTGTAATELPHPMPISLMVWAGAGQRSRGDQGGLGVRGGDAPPRAAAGVRAAAGAQHQFEVGDPL